MDKRKKLQILGAVSAVALAAMPLAMVEGTWDDLGYGTWRNTVITWSQVILIVSFTWLLVAYTKYDTPEGNRTPWKRVGRTALIVWGALIVGVVIALIGVPVISGVVSVIQLSLIPSALAFPVWTAIAAIKDRNAPGPQPAAPSPVWEADVAYTPVPGQAAPGSAPSGATSNNSRVSIVAMGVAVVIAAGAVLWFGDQWVRSQGLNSLLSTVEKTETEMVSFKLTTADATEKFRDQIRRVDPDSAKSQVMSDFRQAGGGLATELKVLKFEWENITVLPWHFDLASFKDQYSDHLNAWISSGEHYASVNDFDTLAGPNPNTSDISATFRIAGDTARNLSLPMFAPDAGKRIVTIFRD